MKSPTEFEKEQFASTDFEIYTSPDIGQPGYTAGKDVYSEENEGKREQREKEIFEEEKYFIPNKERHFPNGQITGYAIKSKQAAKNICGTISRLLRDKRSRTRGSCMFRKRRRRSEKFAIIGYGTQPVDQTDTDTSSVKDESESSSFSTTDDEIPVYDRPGPNNILEQDVILSASEKVLQHQLKNLAMDAMQMKGKGAKLFAKRKHRMEKFVIENDPKQSQSSGQLQSEDLQTEQTKGTSVEQQDYREETGSSHTPVSFHNIHAGKPLQCTSFEPNRSTSSSVLQYENINHANEREHYSSYNNTYCLDNYSNGDHRFDPEKMTLLEEAKRHANEDWFTDEDRQEEISNTFSLGENETNRNLHQTARSQRTRFRSVKPPTPSVKPQDLIPGTNATEFDDHEANACESPFFDACNVQRTPTKSWSSVKFQPKHPKGACSIESTEKVAYPFPISTNCLQGNMKLTPVWAPKAAHLVSPLTEPIQEKTLETTLQKPAFSASTTLFRNDYQQKGTTIKDNAEISSDNSLQSDVKPQTPAVHSLSKQETQQSKLCIFPKRNQSTTMDINLTNIANVSAEPKNYSDIADENSRKPRVAACMKLLDPNRGKYEPKMAVVYKPTPAIGAMLDETDRPSSQNKNKESQKFNKPIKITNGSLQLSCTGNVQRNVCESSQKPQALGTIAGGLKGKGAKMFEKQQKRMESYTKETNGEKQAQSSNLESSQTPKVGQKMREEMSHVLGEFRKLSDTDPEKRPVKKNKDPCHYQKFYAGKRPPSASDFVRAEDIQQIPSDSNNSTTSSMTSYDKGSLASFAKQIEEAEGDEEVFESRKLEPQKVPPKVAPKPKLSRKASSELNSSSTASVESSSCKENTLDASASSTWNKRFVSKDQQMENMENQPSTCNVKSDYMWSSNQGPSESSSIDRLPPPPTYQEVTEKQTQAPKPNFRATSSKNACETYNPSNVVEAPSYLEADNNAIKVVSVSEPCKKSFSCPKPKFTASAPVVKWKPGC